MKITAVLAVAGLFILAAVAAPAAAADRIALSADTIEPLAAGDRAPSFVVDSVEGEPFEFDPESLARPVIVITFRGGWCPYCNLHLSELRHVVPDIGELGIDVLFLSGDRPALLYQGLAEETQAEVDGLDYVILSDAEARAAIAFGIAYRTPARTRDILREHSVDVAGSSMDRHDVLPVPAVFAIGRDGRIAWSYTNADYKVRLPAAELLEVAKELAAAR